MKNLIWLIEKNVGVSDGSRVQISYENRVGSIGPKRPCQNDPGGQACLYRYFLLFGTLKNR